VTCTTPFDSQCTACEEPGHYLDSSGAASTCPACTPVPGCATFVTCTSAVNSVCN
jgi:hypothetical protein